MKSLLDEFRRFDALRDEEAGGGDELLSETVERIPPTYAESEILDMLHPEIAIRLRTKGLTHLYQHQADAVVKALAGANVVVQAPTASGKTLAFQIPMMQRIDYRGRACAVDLPNKGPWQRPTRSTAPHLWQNKRLSRKTYRIMVVRRGHFSTRPAGNSLATASHFDYYSRDVAP